ncbi:MAG: ATP-dependent DNA helicase RecG [Gloeomargarita sp. SKYB31]|nr:ATP-dependent DNA helicase RecG [Gloeomargarita sp. SKYB31]
MAWDGSRVAQALAVEQQAGYPNLQGRQYQFYEFLLEQMRLVPLDWLPTAMINQWEVLLAELPHYPHLTCDQREALIQRIMNLLPHIRTPGAAPRVQEKMTSAFRDGTPIQELDILKPQQKKYLYQLGLSTLGDILRYYPRSYVDYSQRLLIKDLQLGTTVTIIATIRSFRCFTSPKNPQLTILEWWVADRSGRLKINRYVMGKRYANKAWQEQQKRQYPVGTLIAVSGLVKGTKFSKTLTEPQIQIIDEDAEESVGKIVPVYALKGNLKASWVRQAIHAVLPLVKSWPDPLPASLRQRYHLVPLATAYQGIHAPHHSEELKRARTRLVFDELFYLQLSFLRRRQQQRRQTSPVLHAEGELLRKFRAQLPFQLTGAQERVIQEILQDLRQPQPMQRLVQGDVGSGKTVVAVMAMLAAIEAGYQVAMMAPTEVLAEQHYQKLLDWLTPLHIPVELLTGSTKASQRRQILAQLSTGEVPLVVGTHALIQEEVQFAHLGLVVIDEQHRFGVEQRSLLQQKGMAPHVLTMTATPIPRTLALAIHGDLDVSQIDELPPGRQPIQTTVIPGSQRHFAYDLIRREVAQGRQAYIILPLIEESEKLEARAAVAEYEKLQALTFKGLRLGLLHGRQSATERDATLRAFRDGEIQILVSTTVVEVGVDVPNATVMMVENAERFGLAQLHQLRGRVGRGEHPSYCILVTQSQGEDTQQRLQVLTQSQDGFFIAEMDLRLRGPGEILGTRQAGLPDLALASLMEDQDILETARRAAEQLLQQDPDLTQHPQIDAELKQRWERLTGRVVLS